MAESEKKESQDPEAVPIAADAKELADDSLEHVSGGLGVAIPHIDEANSLNGLATKVCLS